MSNFNDVDQFHIQFDLPTTTPTRYAQLLDMGTYEYRLRFLKEELAELEAAQAAGDLPAFFDALLDLAWVAMGTAHYAGLPWQAGWAEVARANFAKVRARDLPGGAHKAWRGAGDVAKPPGWAPPRLREVIHEHNEVARAHRQAARLKTATQVDVIAADEAGEGPAPRRA